jgi:SagB-type dehydrogenase family enzyme
MIKKLPRVPLAASLEEALAQRRSLRDFSDRALTDAEIGTILWAAQGITEKRGGLRTAPSAGATYPLNLYALTKAGVALYHPQHEGLETKSATDARPALAAACLGQQFVAQAPLVLVITGVPSRIAFRYGERAGKYMDQESGHAAQNALLAATALGMGGVPVGAFHEREVAAALSLPKGEIPLYVVPIGRP